MTKHAKKSDHLQLAGSPQTAIVEIPLLMLGAIANIQQSFFELCIDAGQKVLASIMEQVREELCGPRSKCDLDRQAGRAGTTQIEVTLGGRRIAIPQARVRSQTGHEMKLPSFAAASGRDPLDRHTLTSVGCGVSTRCQRRSMNGQSRRAQCRAGTWR